MERSKLKLTVIFLLAVLNLFLLGNVFLQYHQARTYENTTREQTLLYLQNRGIQVDRETVPWESTLSGETETAASQLLPDQSLPAEGLPAHCEIQPARDAATLLMDFVRGLSDLGASCTQIKAIREGYLYSGEGDRAVLTPVWELETDGGTFRLDCAQGTLTQWSA